MVGFFHHRYLQRCVSVFPSLYFDGVVLRCGVLVGAVLSSTVITAVRLVSVLQHSVIPRGSLSLKVLAELPIIVVLMYQVCILLTSFLGFWLLTL